MNIIEELTKSFKPAGNGKAVAYRHEPTSAYVDMTPDIASALLARNTANRPLSQNKVNAFARAMLDGSFDYKNGCAVLVNASGTLVDGQHRLHAIVKTGITQRMEVKTNVSDNAFATIDLGYRGAGDTVAVLGYMNCKQVASSAALLLGVEAAGQTYAVRPGGYQKTAGYQHIVEVIERHPALVESVRLAKNRYVLTPSASACFLYLMENHADAVDFLSRTRQGGDGIGTATQGLARINMNRNSVNRSHLLSVLVHYYAKHVAKETVKQAKVTTVPDYTLEDVAKIANKQGSS